jgi:hypothetical protein
MFLLPMVSTARARIIYVDDDGAGANNGSSWVDACNYLQDALTVASRGDEIRVAQGIYKPDQGVGVTLGDRTATFHLKKGVAIKGGYAGFGEPEPNVRDIAAYETILNGDLNGDDIRDMEDPSKRENSYHVVTGSGTDAPAMLDGFTITAGNANLFPGPDYFYGGGMYNSNGSPTVTNCTFSSNQAFICGGGMYNCDGSSPTLVNCSFTDNSAGGHGGGISNWDSNPTLKNCMFTGNLAWRGGGVHNNRDSSPTLTNCTFSGNLAEDGGGILNGSGSRAALTNCTFSENSAYFGGAVSNSVSNPTLTNCRFSGNSAGIGGGMFNYRSNLTVTGCTFSGNLAVPYPSNPGGFGAGMYNCHSSKPTLINCTFSGNAASESGGGIFNDIGKLNVVTLVNCTFAGNSAPCGSALGCDSYNQCCPSSIHVTNCILWDGGNEIWNNDNSAITITYSDVQSSWPGEGNIDADPSFVSPGYWDANGIWVEGDYHLLTDSLCIDAGDPDYIAAPNEKDLDGNPRIIGGRIDIGAYEFNHIPVANAGPDRTIEAQGPWGATVTLNGSGSSDVDSTPGTNDDINDFDWYKVDPYDPNFADFLGSAEIIDCNLPLGEHIIILEVIDKAGASDANEVTIVVQDTMPPEFSLSVSPTVLWPPSHQMVKITPTWTVSDNCDAMPGVSLVSISINESNTKGNGRTDDDVKIGDDGSIYLRAERSGKGSDRIYTITYQAVDNSGNATVRSAMVTVPHDQR